MKKLIAAIMGLFLVFVILFVFKNQVSSMKKSDSKAEIDGIQINTPTQTNTSEYISQTPTLLSMVTVTPTFTATPINPSITFLNVDAVYQVSSSFEVEINPAVGEYFASGRSQEGDLITFDCDFRKDKPTHLVCSSGPLPFNKQINLQLYQKETSELVFSYLLNYNFATHGEIIPSPTGVVCEIEPQWNGAIPDHQLDMGCFAMSCWQNEDYLWGTDNTCREPWPFTWDFVHPLNNPTP